MVLRSKSVGEQDVADQQRAFCFRGLVSQTRDKAFFMAGFQRHVRGRNAFVLLHWLTLIRCLCALMERGFSHVLGSRLLFCGHDLLKTVHWWTGTEAELGTFDKPGCRLCIGGQVWRQIVPLRTDFVFLEAHFVR